MIVKLKLKNNMWHFFILIYSSIFNKFAALITALLSITRVSKSLSNSFKFDLKYSIGFLFLILDYMGLDLENLTDKSHYYNLGLSIFILCLITILSIVNIIIYLIAIYIFKYNNIEETLIKNYPFLHKILKFYVKTRIVFIIFELILIIWSLSLLLLLAWKLMNI